MSVELIIDPGHGGTDPGGGSSIFYDPEGFYEKNLVLSISLYQYERFKKLGIPVALTRDSDITLSSSKRTKIVRESGAKYCISNHINAAGSEAARGAETIHSLLDNNKFATILLDEIVADGMPKRRVFTRIGNNGLDYYFMHRETRPVQTVIVEYGFATNREDAKLLREKWKVFAESVVRGYCKFTGRKYIKPRDEMKKVKVIVNDKYEEEGLLIDNITHVPLRVIGNYFSVNIRWDNKLKMAYVNEIPVHNSLLINNTTYVGLREAGMLFDAKVGWDNKNKIASIKSKL